MVLIKVVTHEVITFLMKLETAQNQYNILTYINTCTHSALDLWMLSCNWDQKKILYIFLGYRVNNSHWNLSALPQSTSTSLSNPLLTAESPKTMLILSWVRLPQLGLLPLLLLPNPTRNLLIMWRFVHNMSSPQLFKFSHLSNIVQQQWNVSTNIKPSWLQRSLYVVGPHYWSTSGIHWQ